MKVCFKLAAVSFLACAASVANAQMVEFGDYNGSMVKTINGAWTYNQQLSFSSEGTYSLNLSDLEFRDQFEYFGVMVSTPSEKLAEFTYENGGASSVGPIEFEVGEQDYWISVFALTNSVYDVATLGLEIAWAGDMPQVPTPPAYVLMFSALVGLGTLARRKSKHADSSLCA